MLQSFKMAIKSILGNKMRSFLTMLGIIIGVAAVIILVSIVNGYMSSVMESFSDMGVNQISVSVINLPSRSLDVDDTYEFFEENTDLYEEMTPVVNVAGVVKYGNDSLEATSITGYSEDYLTIKDYQLEQGRNISYSDILSRQKVCVAGYYVANELFGGPEDALDQTVKINGEAYKIVGVVERQDDDELEEGGTDDFVWIPYSSATKLTRDGAISSYIFTSISTDDTDECTSRLESFLYETFQDEDLYTVTANSEMLDSLNEQIAMMSGMLGGIAGISLLVAGVGVMNIMLVSVTERTREIGIRKALGAKTRDVMLQFLTESAILSAMGGILGILIGTGLVSLGAMALQVSVVVKPSVIILAVGFSAMVGIFFGLYPASKAAGADPIDALRYE